VTLATVLLALLNPGAVGHLLIILLEIAEELMDTLLEVVGMAPGAAQMVTAYIGLAAFVGLLYFLSRQYKDWCRRTKDNLADYRDMYVDILRAGSMDAMEHFIVWWSGLDWPAKLGVVAFTVFVIIPLLLGLSVGLGMLVSLLI
jgi:hypothetical protein